MQIKLKEEFGNPFITTQKGSIVYKDRWMDFDEGDKELEHLLSNGIFLVKKEDMVIDVPKVKREGEHKGLKSTDF